MSGGPSDRDINRRKVLRTTGAAVGGSLTVGASGTASASDRWRGRSNDHGPDSECGQSNQRGLGHGGEGCSSVQKISTDGDTIVTLVEALGEKFLFREAAAYRKADDVSTLSDNKAYEATESGHPVEFGKIDSSVSDLDSSGTVGVQQIDFTPENFIKEHDVDFKQICNGCCGDILWNSHYALEIHLQGGGAFSTLSASGIAGVLCWAVASAGAILTGGISGALAAGSCSVITAAVDQLIDVEMIPNKAELSIAYWDQDETNWWGLNNSPTIAVGLSSNMWADYNDVWKIGEIDYNGHLMY